MRNIFQTLERVERTEDTHFVIIPSRVDRAKYGGSDWNAWSDSVARRYQACIELDINVGRATADVVNKMLALKKPVYIHESHGDKSGFLHKVTGVIDINPEDWQNGWQLCTRE